MLKPLHMHIGRAKTGTTAIQFALYDGRPQLAAQGICYPYAGARELEPRLSHAVMALACTEKTRYTVEDMLAVRRDFEDETSRFDRIVVSSEGFQNILDPSRLRQFFRRGEEPKRYHVKSICYLREFLDMARSTYAQVIQASATTATFEEFCRRFDRFSLKRFIAFWDAFADETVFLGYEQALMADGSVLPGFFAQLGIAIPATTARPDTNPTITGNLLAFKFLLNHLNLHVFEYYHALLRLAVNHARFRGPFPISAALAAALRSRDGGYNEELRQRFGNMPLRDFTSAPAMLDTKCWEEDLALILAEPELASLRDVAELRTPPTALASTISG